jgi:alpha-L-arabinofuranosidase
VDGAYRQSEPAIAWSFIPETGGAAFTVSVKARKIAGQEGFIIPLGTADGRRVQWNIGGWGNRRTAVQAADAVVGEQVDGTIETGRWYDIKVEVKGRTVRGHLDGQLVQERTLPRIDKVLAISGRETTTGDIILKVVNSAPEAAPMTITVSGAPKLGTQATLTVLTAGNPLDENTFEDPMKVSPKTSRLAVAGPAIAHTFAPHSLTILRIPTR